MQDIILDIASRFVLMEHVNIVAFNWHVLIREFDYDRLAWLVEIYLFESKIKQQWPSAAIEIKQQPSA